MKHCMFRTYLRQGRFSVIDMTNGSNVDVRFIATEFFYRKGSHGALSLQQRQDSIATTEKRQSHHGVMKDLSLFVGGVAGHEDLVPQSRDVKRPWERLDVGL